MVINTHLRASPDSLRTTPLTSTRRNTLINPTMVTYYNYRNDSYFILLYLELRDIGNIKEIEEDEEEISDELGKEEP